MNKLLLSILTIFIVFLSINNTLAVAPQYLDQMKKNYISLWLDKQTIKELKEINISYLCDNDYNNKYWNIFFKKYEFWKICYTKDYKLSLKDPYILDSEVVDNVNRLILKNLYIKKVFENEYNAYLLSATESKNIKNKTILTQNDQLLNNVDIINAINWLTWYTLYINWQFSESNNAKREAYKLMEQKWKYDKIIYDLMWIYNNSIQKYYKSILKWAKTVTSIHEIQLKELSKYILKNSKSKDKKSIILNSWYYIKEIKVFQINDRKSLLKRISKNNWILINNKYIIKNEYISKALENNKEYLILANVYFKSKDKNWNESNIFQYQQPIFIYYE